MKNVLPLTKYFSLPCLVLLLRTKLIRPRTPIPEWTINAMPHSLMNYITFDSIKSFVKRYMRYQHVFSEMIFSKGYTRNVYKGLYECYIIVQYYSRINKVLDGLSEFVLLSLPNHHHLHLTELRLFFLFCFWLCFLLKFLFYLV